MLFISSKVAQLGRQIHGIDPNACSRALHSDANEKNLLPPSTPIIL